MKTKKTTTAKISTLVFAMAMTSGSIFGQQHGSVWVKIPAASSLSITGEGENLSTSSGEFNTLIETYNVQSVAKAFPSSRSAGLQDVYEISCSCDENDLLQAVALKHNLFVSPEIGPKYEALYTPNDYGTTTAADYALDLIKSQQAWSLTQGSADVIIGVTDTNYDPQHEELVSKYVYLTPGLTNSNITHGTAVAITAAGATDNGVGKSSIGFNSSLQLRGMTYNEILAASYSGARIINASWVSGCTFSQYAQDVITEVYNNGSIVIASAGNGTTCGGANNFVYPASYEHVLSVTSVGPQNNHERFVGNALSAHQHNTAVDLCAPGYDVLISGASGSYISGTGTSYAAAYVSGAAALILSVNPCLTPENLIFILKTSTDDVYTDNPAYEGLLGTGRLNVAAAVQLALDYGTINVESSVVTICETGNVSVALNAISGDAPYTALWSSGEEGMEFYPTESGVYSYVVTDANGCIRNGEVSVEITTPMSFESVNSNVLCHGDSNGSIDLSISGGVGPYSFSWSNGAQTEDLESIEAGDYVVEVTDSLGCSFVMSANITEPTAIEVTVVAVDPTTFTSGNIDITVSGGTGFYTYSWSNGKVTEDLTGLTGGVYTVYVSDSNGCTISVTVELDFATINDFNGDTTGATTGSDEAGSSTAGIDEETGTVQLSVYPNPATDYIQVVNGTDTEVTVVILDHSGRMLAQSSAPQGTQTIDVTAYAAGTYFVKGIANGKQVFAEKVIKF